MFTLEKLILVIQHKKNPMYPAGELQNTKGYIRDYI